MKTTIPQVIGRTGLAFLSLFIGLPLDVWAGPEGAQVINGQVQISQQGNQTTIEASDRAIINYMGGFNIKADESVQFVQPSAAAWVLNRDLSGMRSDILGALLANGRVAIVNPAGVYFSATARVDVNQLVASGLNLADSDFLSGNWEFQGGDGAIINEGSVTAERMFLFGRQVVNNGNLYARDGLIVLAAGEHVLVKDMDSSVYVEVDGKSLEEIRGVASSEEGRADGDRGSAIENSGTIDVGAGRIILGVGDSYAQAFTNTESGKVVASVSSGTPGKIEVAAASGMVRNKGVIAAASGNQGGGSIRMDAPIVSNVASDAHHSNHEHEGEAEGEEGNSDHHSGDDVTNASGTGKILAPGGDVGMYGRLVIQAGLIDANTIQGDTGNVQVISLERTIIGGHSLTRASGGEGVGDGGTIIFNSLDAEDSLTAFLSGAKIEARGGDLGGNGGFVEVSSKVGFVLEGDVDATAPAGERGTFLIDPLSLNIKNGAQSAAPMGAQLNPLNCVPTTQQIVVDLSQGFVGDNDLDGGDDIGCPNININLISSTQRSVQEGFLQSIAGNVDLRLDVTGAIVLEDLADNTLSLLTGSGRSLIVNAGSITFNDPNDQITTQAGTIAFTIGGDAIMGRFDSNGGNISFIAGNDINVRDVVADGGNITMLSGNNTVLTGAFSTGNINLNNSSLTTTGAITLQARGFSGGVGGTILNAGGAIQVGTNQALTLTTNGTLRVGGGGVSNVVGAGGTTSEIRLDASSIPSFGLGGGTVELATPQAGAAIWDSLTAVGQTGVTVLAAQTTDAGALSLTATTGNILVQNASTNFLTSATTLALRANAASASITVGGLVANTGGTLLTGTEVITVEATSGSIALTGASFDANTSVGGAGLLRNVRLEANALSAASAGGGTTAVTIQDAGNVTIRIVGDGNPATADINVTAGDFIIGSTATPVTGQIDVYHDDADADTDADTAITTSVAGSINWRSTGGNIRLDSNSLTAANISLATNTGSILTGSPAVQGVATMSLNAAGVISLISTQAFTFDNVADANEFALAGTLTNIALAVQSQNAAGVVQNAVAFQDTAFSLRGILAKGTSVTLGAGAALTSSSTFSLTTAQNGTADVAGSQTTLRDIGVTFDPLLADGTIIVTQQGTGIQEQARILSVAGDTITIQGNWPNFIPQINDTYAATPALHSISLTAGTGNIDLGGNNLTAARGVTLRAPQGAINNAVTVTVKNASPVDANYIVEQLAAITGGGLLNVPAGVSEFVNLDVRSTGGTVTLDQNKLWNTLKVEGNAGIIVTQTQSTNNVAVLPLTQATLPESTGAITLIANTGNIDFQGNINLDSDANMTLRALAGDIINVDANDRFQVGLDPAVANAAAGVTYTLQQNSAITVNAANPQTGRFFATLPNSNVINLDVTSNVNALNFDQAFTWNTLTGSGGNGLNVTANQTTDSGNIRLTAAGGNLAAGGSALSSASDMILTATAGGVVSTGNLAVKVDGNLTFSQANALTIGTGGVSGIQNKAAVNLFATSTAGTVSLGGVAADAFTFNSIAATGQSVLLNAAQQTDAIPSTQNPTFGQVVLTATNGNINMNGRDLTAGGNMTLAATQSDTGEILNATGNIRVGSNNNLLTLSQSKSLLIGVGTGGILAIQNPNQVNLVVQSDGPTAGDGNVTVSQGFTWGSLNVSGRNSVFIQGAQTAATGSITLTATELAVNAGTNALAATVGDITLSALGGIGSITAGSLSAGTGLAGDDGISIRVETTGVITVNSIVGGNRDVLLVGAGAGSALELKSTAGLAMSNVDDLTIRANVTNISGGNYTVQATRNIDLSTGPISVFNGGLTFTSTSGGLRPAQPGTITTAGAIVMDFQQGLTGQTVTDPIVLTQLATTTNNANGNIDLKFLNSITLKSVNTGTAGTLGNLNVESRAGAVILDGAMTARNVDVLSAQALTTSNVAVINVTGTLELEALTSNVTLNLNPASPNITAAGNMFLKASEGGLVSSADLVSTNGNVNLEFPGSGAGQSLSVQDIRALSGLITILGGGGLGVVLAQGITGNVSTGIEATGIVMTASRGNLNLNNRSLISSGDIRLEAFAGTISGGTDFSQGNLKLRVGVDRTLTLTQSTNLRFGTQPSGATVSGIENPQDTVLVATSSAGSITFENGFNWNALQGTARGSVTLLAGSGSQVTNTGNLVLVAQTGSIITNNNALIAQGLLDLSAPEGIPNPDTTDTVPNRLNGDVTVGSLFGTGVRVVSLDQITVGALIDANGGAVILDADNLSAAGSLTIRNATSVALNLKDKGDTVDDNNIDDTAFFVQGDFFITASGTIDASVPGTLSGAEDRIFTAGGSLNWTTSLSASGAITLGSTPIEANSITLSATGANGTITNNQAASSKLTINPGQMISITQGGPLIVGTGATSLADELRSTIGKANGTLDRENIQLVLSNANSPTGTITFANTFLWNSITVTGGAGITVNTGGSQNTSTGDIVVTCNTGNIVLNDALRSARDMTLQTLGALGAINISPGIFVSVGGDRTLTLAQNTALTVGTGGIVGISNPDALHLVANSTGNNVTFASPFTWNSLIVSGQNGVTLSANQTTDGVDVVTGLPNGTISVTAVTGNITAAAQSLSANGLLSLSANGANGIVTVNSGSLTGIGVTTQATGTNGSLNFTGTVIDARPGVGTPGNVTLTATTLTGTTGMTIQDAATVTLDLATSISVTNGNFAIGNNLTSPVTGSIIATNPDTTTVTNGDLNWRTSNNVASAINFGSNDLTANNLTLTATGALSTIVNTDGRLAASVNGAINLSQGANLFISLNSATSLADEIQNQTAVNLTLASSAGSINFTQPFIWNSLTAAGQTGIIINAGGQQSSDSGSISLTATTSNLDMGGANGGVVSASDLTLSAPAAGLINAEAAVIGVGVDRTLTISQNNRLTFGGVAGLSNVLATQSVNLNATTTGASNTISFDAALNWNSITAVGQGGVTINAAQTTDDVNIGNIVLTGTAGTITLNASLSSARDMTLRADNAVNPTGAITFGGALSVGLNRTITLSQAAALTVNNATNVQNSAGVNMVANSTSSTVTYASPITWNSLASTGQTGITINADQITDSGNLSLTATTGNINSGNNALTAAGSLTLSALGAGSDMTTGSLTGRGVTLLANDNLTFNTSTINSGITGNVTIQGTTITANNNFNIQAAVNVTLGLTDTITVNGGAFTLDNSVTGSITATSFRTISILGNGGLTWTPGGAVQTTDILTQGGNIVVTPGAGQNLTITGAPGFNSRFDANSDLAGNPGTVTIGESGTGNGNIIATKGLDIRNAGNVTLSNSGTVDVSGGAFTINTGITGAINASPVGAIQVQNNNRLDFNTTSAGGINYGVANITAGEITLLAPNGSVQESTGSLGITVDGGDLLIRTLGGQTFGNGNNKIAFSGTPANLDLISDSTGGTVTFETAITLNSITATSNGAITITVQLSTDQGAIALTTTAGGSNIVAQSTLNAQGAVTLTTAGAGSDIDVQQGLTGAGITVTPSRNLTLSGTLDPRGAQITLGETQGGVEGTVTANNGLSMQNTSAVTFVNSGALTVQNGTFTINATSNITATAPNLIQVLGGAANNLVWSAAIIDTKGVTTTGGNITFTSGASPNLSLNINGALDAGSPGAVGSITLGSGAGNVTLVNGLTILDASNVVLGNTGNFIVSAGAFTIPTTVTGNVDGDTPNQISVSGANTVTWTPGGTIEASNITTSGGAVTLRPGAGQNLTLKGLIDAGGGAITLGENGAGNGNITTTAGLTLRNATNVILDNSGSITVAGGTFNINNLTGAITATASAGITVQGAGDALNWNAGTTIDTVSVTTTGGDIVMTPGAGQDLTLRGALDAGTAGGTVGVVSLGATGAGADIIATVAGFTIRDASSVTLANGGSMTVNNGSFTISGVSGAINASTAAGGILVQGAANSLSWTAGAAIDVVAITTQGGGITLAGGSGQSLTLRGALDAGTLGTAVGAVSLGGISTGVLNATTAGLTIQDASSVSLLNVGAVTVNGGGFVINNVSGNVTSTSPASITVQGAANNLSWTPGGAITTTGITTSGGNITLTPGGGQNLTVSGALDAGTAGIAVGNITLGGGAGNITVTNALTIQDANVLNLASTGTFTVSNGGFTIPNTVTTVTANAPSSIAVQGAGNNLIWTPSGTINVGNVTTGGGSITLTPGAGLDLTLSGAAGTLNASGGTVSLGETGAGNGNIIANNGLTIQNALDVTLTNSGAVTLGAGNFTLSVTGRIDSQSPTSINLPVAGGQLDWSSTATDGGVGFAIRLGGGASAINNATAIRLNAPSGTIAGAGTLGVINTNPGTIQITQSGATLIGAGGFNLGGDTTLISLTATSANNTVTINPFNLRALTASGQSLNLAAGLYTTNASGITLTATSQTGDLSLNGASLTTLSTNPATSLITLTSSRNILGTGTLRVDADGGDILLSQAGAMTFGPAGIQFGGTTGNIDLTATSTANAVSLGAAFTLNSLTATGQTGVTVTGTQTTDAGTMSLVANTGDVNLSNNNLSVRTDLTLRAPAGNIANPGGMLTYTGAGNHGFTLAQNAALTIGAGFFGLPTSDIINLNVSSTSGAVTFGQQFTWNTLTGTGGAGITVNAAQTADSGALAFTATGGSINAAANALTATGGQLTLTANGGAVTTGVLSGTNIVTNAGTGITLNGAANSTGGQVVLTTTAGALNAGNNAITATNGQLVLSAAGGSVTTGNLTATGAGVAVSSGGAVTVGSLSGTNGSVTAATGITANGAANTTAGQLSLNTATGSINAGNNTLTANGGQLALSAAGGNVTAGSLNGGGVTVTSGGTVSLAAPAATTINAGGGAVTVTGTNVAAAQGLDIRNATSINLNNTGTVTVTGNFTVNNAVSGNITASVPSQITVNNGSLTWAPGGTITARNLTASGGSVNLTAVGAGANITAGSLTGAGLTVNTGGTITLSSTLDAEGLAMRLTGATLNATASGLELRDSNLVDLNITNNLNVSGGAFNVNNGIVGTIDATDTSNIVLNGNALNWLTTQGGINYGKANITDAASISLKATQGTITATTGVLAVRANASPVTLESSGSLTIGTNGIRLGGNTSFIDLNVSTPSASITVADSLTLNSLSATANSGAINVNAAQTTDAGAINLTASSGTITTNQNLTAGGSLSLSASSGIISAQNLTAGGSLTLSSSSLTTGNATAGGDLSVTGAGTIRSNVSGGAALRSTGGNLTVNSTSHGTIEGFNTLSAGGNISINGDPRSSGAMTLAAGNDVAIASTTIATGDLRITAGREIVSVTPDGKLISEQGGVFLTAQTIRNFNEIRAQGNIQVQGNFVGVGETRFISRAGALTLAGLLDIAGTLLLDAPVVNLSATFGGGTNLTFVQQGINLQEQLDVQREFPVVPALPAAGSPARPVPPTAVRTATETYEDVFGVPYPLTVEAKDVIPLPPGLADPYSGIKVGNLPALPELLASIKRLNIFLLNPQKLNILAEEVENNPEQFDALRQTNEWLQDAEKYLRTARKIMELTGEDPSVASGRFLSKYAMELQEKYPRTYERLVQFAEEER